MKKCLILSFAFCYVSLFSATSSVGAFELIGGKYSSGNISYTDVGLSATYSLAMQNGVIAWNEAGTDNVNFEWTTSKTQAQVLFKEDDYGNVDWNARCANKPVHTSGTYTRSHIDFNTYRMDGMTNSKKQGVAAHELGHALGLDHVTDKYQVMCTSANGRAVSVPGDDDIDGANYLY